MGKTIFERNNNKKTTTIEAEKMETKIEKIKHQNKATCHLKNWTII